MLNNYTFFHRVTGFVADLVTACSAHLNARIAQMGGMMLFIVGLNTVVVSGALILNGYHFVSAIFAGIVMGGFTWLVERAIVSSIKPPDWKALFFRVLLLTVMLSVHFIFVDLALHHNALAKIGAEREAARLEVNAIPVANQHAAVNLAIRNTEAAIDSLDQDLTTRYDRMMAEPRGQAGTGKFGTGPMTNFEIRMYEEYEAGIYSATRQKLTERLASLTVSREQLTARLTGIRAKVTEYDYDAESLITKLMYLDDFLSRPENKSAWLVILVIFLTVCALELSVLYLRGRLEDEELAAIHQRLVETSAKGFEEKLMLDSHARDLENQAARQAATEFSDHVFQMKQAENLLRYGAYEIEMLEKTTTQEAKAIERLPVELHDRVKEIYHELREELRRTLANVSTSTNP